MKKQVNITPIRMIRIIKDLSMDEMAQLFMVSKAYIRVIESQDSKKYCITPDGEGYFVQRFQG